MNKRQKEVIQSQLNDEKEILKKLKEIYERANKDIELKIAVLLARKDEENLQSIIYQLDYQRALKAQINAILDALNTQQFETISKYLVECYESGFLGTLYDLQGQGIPLIFPIDQKQVVKAVTHDTKLSKKLYTKLGEDVNELKKKIRVELSRGIAQAYSYADIARNIRSHTNIGINRAIRIARTEGHRITTQATFDAQHKAKEAGADIVKQWDSTLDGRTRPLHRQLDGQIRELDDPFEIGGHKAQYPSGFGKASMDVNCRCVLLQRARWELEEDLPFTKRDNFSKELETFGSRADYDEFKKVFFSPENVKYMNYIYTLEERYGTKNFNKILASMNEQEYKHYSELLKNNPFYKDYGGRR